MKSNDTPWLEDSQQQAWRSFLQMTARLTGRLGQELQADSELSLADFDVLVQLSETEGGRVRVLELASALQWEKSRMSHHLARMTGRGLISREQCPQDRRGAYAVITDAGRHAIEAAAPQHVAAVRRYVFDALTTEQVDALATVADRVLDRLSAPPQEAGAEN